jgi:hypothetical protein
MRGPRMHDSGAGETIAGFARHWRGCVVAKEPAAVRVI